MLNVSGRFNSEELSRDMTVGDDVKDEPFFEEGKNIAPQNVSALIGKTAFLTCVVRNLGKAKSVSFEYADIINEKRENLSSYMMEILSFDRSLTQFQGFLFCLCFASACQNLEEERKLHLRMFQLLLEKRPF